MSEATLNKKDRKWLEHIEVFSDSNSGMYRGARVDHIPARPASRLRKAGYIFLECPFNPSHKDRWVITSEGRDALIRARTAHQGGGHG